MHDGPGTNPHLKIYGWKYELKLKIERLAFAGRNALAACLIHPIGRQLNDGTPGGEVAKKKF